MLSMWHLALVFVANTAAATAGLCSSIGCSVHKMDGRSCQCNFHCDAHHDCCSDFAATCPNLTDPCLEHKCKSHAPGAASADTSAAASKAHEHTKAHSSTASTGNATAHEHTKGHSPTTKAAASKEGESGKSESKSKSTTDAKPSHGHHDESDAKKGHHEHSAKPSGGGTSGAKPSSGASSSGSASADGGSKESKPHEHAHEHEKKEGEHDKKAGSDHPHHEKRGAVSWLIVLLACATGLTIPITLSIVLILRARGVCCASTAVHQRIDLPPKTPTETAAETNGATPSDRQLYAVPEGSEEMSLTPTAGRQAPEIGAP